MHRARAPHPRTSAHAHLPLDLPSVLQLICRPYTLLRVVVVPARRPLPRRHWRTRAGPQLGADAKNYDELAKVEKLKPMELELRKLEDLAVSIEKDFARMKQVEEKHRDTNGDDPLRAEHAIRACLDVPADCRLARPQPDPLCGPLRTESTNERMLYFSLFSMLCLTVLAVWQVLYLKRYFKQKKLI